MCCITVSLLNDAFCCLLGLAAFSHLLLHCAQMDVYVTLCSPRIAPNKQQKSTHAEDPRAADSSVLKDEIGHPSERRLET